MKGLQVTGPKLLNVAAGSVFQFVHLLMGFQVEVIKVAVKPHYHFHSLLIVLSSWWLSSHVSQAPLSQLWTRDWHGGCWQRNMGGGISEHLFTDYCFGD